MSDYISFIWPHMLLSLLTVPLMVWLYLRLRRNQEQKVAQLGTLGLSQNRGRAGLRRWRRLSLILFLAGLICLLVSLARPQMTVTLPRVGGTVILAFDVSSSMTAEDLEPSRLDAAKDAARLFVESQPSTITIGVIAFGTGGLIVQQPTQDRAEILDTIERLSPQGGTSLGQGIFTALNAIAGETLTIEESAIEEDSGLIQIDELRLDDYSSSVIILLTDGENTTSPDPLNVAQVAAEAGVRIYPVGIGSAEGTNLEVDGFNLITQLDETTLTEIASLTNGKYYRAEDEETLREIYRNVDLQLTVDAELMEITSILAAASLLLILAGGTISMFMLGYIP